MAEYSRAKLTGVQANSIITAVSGAPLTPAEQTEVQTLVNTVISIAVTGSTAAQGDGRSQRAMRLFEIDQVLLLADTGAPDRHRERERVEVAALLYPRAWTHASLAKRWFNPVKGEEFS